MKKLLLLLLFASFWAQGQRLEVNPATDGMEGNIATIRGEEYTVIGDSYIDYMTNYFWPELGTIHYSATIGGGTEIDVILYDTPRTDLINFNTFPEFFSSLYRSQNGQLRPGSEKRLLYGGVISDVHLIQWYDQRSRIFSFSTDFDRSNLRLNGVVRIERFGADSYRFGIN